MHPPLAPTVLLRANAALAAGDFTQAETLYREALERDPHLPEALLGMGAVARRVGKLDVSQMICRHVLSQFPRHGRATFDLAVTLHASGNHEQARVAFAKTLELEPENAAAHANLGMTRLTLGDFAAGWPEYEWRRRARAGGPVHHFHSPEWTGEDVDRKRLFVYPEQGNGDIFQFCRYVPLLAQRGADVTIGAPPDLAPALASLVGANDIVTTPAEAGDCDYHASLLSLPARFGTEVHSIPADVPYLRADPALVDEWAARYPLDPSPLMVGLCWQGRRTHPNDHNRSIHVERLRPLSEAADVRFVSLSPEAPCPEWVEDLSGKLSDWSQTAALIHRLDVVITVDTAVAHLAGAMAKRVLLLLPFVPDWRWMLTRSDSPWYPTLKLFRQPERGNWNIPIGRVKNELTTLAIQLLREPGTP